jgi:hypothetical protein
MQIISKIHEVICQGEKGSWNHTLRFRRTSMKMLSNEKNLAIPWYLFSLMEKYHEKVTMSIVPIIRTM